MRTMRLALVCLAFIVTMWLCAAAIAGPVAPRSGAGRNAVGADFGPIFSQFSGPGGALRVCPAAYRIGWPWGRR